MIRMGIRELKQQTSAAIRRVVNGDTVEVTDHGHPVARIVPLAGDSLDQMIAEGRVTAARGNPSQALEALGLPLPAEPGMRPTSEILAEMRADER